MNSSPSRPFARPPVGPYACPHFRPPSAGPPVARPDPARVATQTVRQCEQSGNTDSTAPVRQCKQCGNAGRLWVLVEDMIFSKGCCILLHAQLRYWRPAKHFGESIVVEFDPYRSYIGNPVTITGHISSTRLARPCCTARLATLH